uniref:Uncharacterized protein n=1 Tax=Panagrolaimus superbus TaxID=310955 RepID=A0A914Y7H4_9BILA
MPILMYVQLQQNALLNLQKFKEKKILLRDPLIETIDAVYASSNIEVISDEVAAALGKPNPNIKIQTNLFLYRVFKTFNAQTAPKKVVKALTPLIAKCTGESDAEAREASFAALGAIMKAIGKANAMTMLGDVSNDKTKMERIEKFYNQAVEEAGVEVVSEMVQSMHKSADTPAAEKPPSGPKVVKPKGKPKSVEEQPDEEEEPLRPMGKQDDDEKAIKGRSASKNNRRSVAPAPPKSPEPVEPSGVLSSASNRNARIKDEKNLKVF